MSVALKRLADDGLVRRGADKGWLLSHEPPSELSDMRGRRMPASDVADDDRREDGPEDDLERLVA